MTKSNFIILLMLIYSVNVRSEVTEQPGGYEEPGGYDPVAAQKAEQALAIKQAAKDLALKKAAIKKHKLDVDAREAAAITPQNMAKIEDLQVCINAGKEWRTKHTTNWLSELKKRNLKFNEADLKGQAFDIGGYECDIYAAIGKPTRINTTVNSYGTKLQMVYPKGYVYLTNGVITSLQY